MKIVPSDSQDIWIDGRVVGYKKTTDGDGNATLNSVFYLEGEKYIAYGSHIEMLYRSKHILERKLCK